MRHYDHRLECPLEPDSHGPEFELLLTCCRPRPSAKHFARQQALAAAGLDTRKLLALGIRHKASPLLYCNLRQHPPGTFADELLLQLAEQHTHNTRKAMQSLQATHQLAGTGLPLCVLKGLDVAARAYGDLAARHVGDIDILIDSSHLDAGVARLFELGWDTPYPVMLHAGSRVILQRVHPDCAFVRPGTPHLELHWRLSRNPHEFPLAHWSQLELSHQSGTGVAGLNDEDLLIYLCLHGSKHGWGRLKWLFDLPNVLETHEPDWQRLWQRAHSLGAGLAVQQGLLLAQRYCGALLDERITRGFKYHISPTQWQGICRYQQGPALWVSAPPVSLRLHQWANHLRTIHSTSAIVWHCTSVFYPKLNDYQQLKLPGSLQWLYFPLRPVLWGIRRIRGWRQRVEAINDGEMA